MSAFRLNSDDVAFKNRQKKVFDQLLVLEKNRKAAPPTEPEKHEPTTDRRVQKRQTRPFRGKESIFKKPQNPAPKNYVNKIPDFKKNPHKWTKYSLEDVQEMTDESNTRSAMEFLKELAERRNSEKAEQKLEKLPSKVVFNKHVRKANANETEERASFSNSKLIMPEYVIGQKPPKKDRQSKKDKLEKGKELRLDHLTWDDD